jgi:hypothetical protein
MFEFHAETCRDNDGWLKTFLKCLDLSVSSQAKHCLVMELIERSRPNKKK